MEGRINSILLLQKFDNALRSHSYLHTLAYSLSIHIRLYILLDIDWLVQRSIFICSVKYKHDTEIVNVEISILDDRAAAVCNDGVLIFIMGKALRYS